MAIRAILLNSKNRIEELNQKFNLKLPEFFEGRLLIRLTDLSSGVKEQLAAFAKKPMFCWSTFDSDHGMFLIPDELKLLQEAKGNSKNALLKSMAELLNRTNWPRPVWQTNHGPLNFARGPLIMGILNVTPDSFSDGGRFNDLQAALDRALQMEAEGASIIDIGGESTRPGAEPVPEQEELRRVIPVIEKLRQKTDVLISIDTYKSRIAEAALQAGADIVNDISGAQFDRKMVDVVKKYDCPLIIMHIKGTPKNMQQNPFYHDVTEEIIQYFEKRIHELEQEGVNKIIIDPGIGFGKRVEDNLHLLRDLKDFTFLNKPILMGTSRKSFIGKVLNREVDDRLFGSLTTQILAVQNGADIVRVHDVKATYDALKMLKAVNHIESA